MKRESLLTCDTLAEKSTMVIEIFDTYLTINAMLHICVDISIASLAISNFTKFVFFHMQGTDYAWVHEQGE